MTADILAARSGDTQAFTRLVETHANLVCAIATAILGDIRAGEEVSQEVFVQAWTGLKNLKNPAAFGGWLRQLARNRAHDAVRQRARRRENPGGDSLERMIDPAADIGERLDASRQEQAMWAALDELDGDHREVLVLFYREDQSVRQVATLLELQEATVRKRLSRARNLLRDELATRLASTVPGANFVAGVATAIAIAAPASAHAATGGLAVLGLKGVLSGAMVGGTLGLAGVWLGYYQASRGKDAPRTHQLRRVAIIQGAAVTLASLAFLLLPPIPGTFVAMPMLLAVLAGSMFSYGTPNRYGLIGLAVGALTGLSAAAMGLQLGGFMDGWLAAALLVQMVCFLSVPLAVGYAVTTRFGVQLRWWFAGALGWMMAMPFLALSGPLAGFLGDGGPLAGALSLSLMAGVFEETSRFGLYKLIHRFRGPLEGHRAVVLGLGHGGFEALIFGAGALAMVLSGSELLDPSSHALFGLSRLPLMLCHVGFTLMIWRAVSRGQLRWWGLAIAAHIGLDLAAFAGPIVLGDAGLPVAGVLILALAAYSAHLVRHALR